MMMRIIPATLQTPYRAPEKKMCRQDQTYYRLVDHTEQQFTDILNTCLELQRNNIILYSYENMHT